jgi:hypothetical protein
MKTDGFNQINEAKTIEQDKKDSKNRQIEFARMEEILESDFIIEGP